MSVRILVGDALSRLQELPNESVQCVVTSPPYFQLRDYGVDGQIGLERTPLAFLEALWVVFDEVKRVLRPDGLLFVNIGDSYAGSGKGPSGHNGIGGQEQRQGFTGGRGKTSFMVQRGDDPAWSNNQQRSPGVEGVAPKNLMLIPQRFAIGMQDRGWIVRSQIAWCKTSAMPESVRDRPTSAWEPIWMFSKSRTYFFDQDAVRGLSAPEWPTRVVEQPNFIDKSLILGHDLGFSPPPPPWARTPSGIDHRWLRIKDAVRYASALFQRTEFQNEIGLPSLNSEVRQQLLDDANRALISGAPVVHGAPVDASRLLDADRAAEDFLKQLQRRQIAHPNGHRFGEGLRPPLMAHSPGIGSNGDAPIGVDHTGEVGERSSFTHDKEYTPGGATSSRGGNLRNYWLLGPQPSSLEHYAGFPPELPKRCILAGTSEKGACPECMTPWARVVERETTAKDRQTGRGWQAGIANQENWASGTPTHSGLANSGYQRGVTTGWQQSCQCPPADPVPCVVLDPFLGSGTTLMVASRLGRDGIGIELKPEYATMAEGKIARDAGALFPEDIQVTAPRQPTLFDEQEAV